jgi:ABC-2 type transport system permease protein
VVQWIGNLLPATHFIQISRGLITKGVGLEVVSPYVTLLLVYAVGIILLAAGQFKKRLD